MLFAQLDAGSTFWSFLPALLLGGGGGIVEGVQAANRNNMVIAPLNTVMRRFEDNTSYLKDEIDGIYMKVGPNVDSIETSNVVRAILAATHKDAGDFTVVVPAGLALGANRRLAGEDARAGAVVLPAGRRLSPQDVALAAAK